MAMGGDLAVDMVLRLVDQVSGPLQGIQRRVSSVDETARRGHRGVAGAAAGISRQFSRASQAARGLVGETGQLAQPQAVAGGLRQIAALGAGYIGITQSIRGTVGAAINFESAMADVRKVMDVTPRQFKEMRETVLNLSQEMPVTAEGFAAIYAAAGQAGIARRDLETFATTTAKVGVAWDVTAGRAGQALAEIKAALGVPLEEVRLLADAMNYLSNNTAASAPRLLDYTQRVASVASTAGMTAKDAAAFGASMISAGFSPEVAATSFRNMLKALTSGQSATKRQKTAYRLLGFDPEEVSKAMQEDAVGIATEVIEAIQKLPEHQRLSVATDLFGSEARALAPLIDDLSALRRALGLVAEESRYAGSVGEEYAARAETTANALTRLRNNLTVIGVTIGDSVLPAIASASNGLADRLGGFAKRSNDIIDRMSAAWKGLLEGFGPVGDGDPFAWLKDSIRSLDRYVFGSRLQDPMLPHAPRDVGELRRIQETFRGLSASLRTLAGGEIRKGIGELGGALGRFVEDLGALGVFGGALVVGGLGTAVGLLASSITALVTSKFVRLGAVATAIAELVESLKGADSIRDVAAALRDLSAIGWFGVGLGALWVAKQIWSVVRAARALARVGGRAGRAVRSMTPGRAASPAASSPSSQGPARPSPTSPGGSAVDRFLRRIGGRVALPLLGLELGRQTRDVVDEVRKLVDSLRLSREEYVERYGLRSRKGEIPRFEPDFAARAQRSQREDYTTLSVGGFRPRDRTLDTREGVDNRHQIRRGKDAAADLPSAWSGGNTRMWWPPQHGDETPPANPQTARKALDAVVQVAKLLGTEVGRPSEVRNQARAIAGAVADAIRSIEIIPTPRRRPGRAPTPRTRPGDPVDELTRKLRSQSGGEPSWRRDFKAMRGEVQAATEALQGLRSAFELGGGAGEDQIPVVDPDLKKPPARDKTPWAAAIPMLRRILVGGGQFNPAGFGFALVQLSNTMARLTDAVGSMLTAAPSSPQGVGDGVPDSGLQPDLPRHRAVRAAQELRRELEATGREAGRGFERGVSEGTDGAVEEVRAVPDRVGGAFAGLGPRLYRSGLQATAQLAAGIRAGQEQVAAASRSVADTVAAHFPASPARRGPLRRLPYMGSEIVRQLSRGMERASADGGPSRVAAGIASAVSGQASRAPAAQPAVPAITINISDINLAAEGAAGAGEEIAQILRDRLQSAMEDIGITTG